MPTVLLAEADCDLRETYLGCLSRNGFLVETVNDGLQCLAKLRQFVPDLLILDLEMPWGGGDGVLGILREDPRLLPGRVVLTSTVAPAPALDGPLSQVVVHTLTKPFRISALLEFAALAASVSKSSRQPTVSLVGSSARKTTSALFRKWSV